MSTWWYLWLTAVKFSDAKTDRCICRQVHWTIFHTVSDSERPQCTASLSATRWPCWSGQPVRICLQTLTVQKLRLPQITTHAMWRCCSMMKLTHMSRLLFVMFIYLAEISRHPALPVFDVNCFKLHVMFLFLCILQDCLFQKWTHCSWTSLF